MKRTITITVPTKDLEAFDKKHGRGHRSEAVARLIHADLIKPRKKKKNVTQDSDTVANTELNDMLDG